MNAMYLQNLPEVVAIIILLDDEEQYDEEKWQCSQIRDPEHEKAGKDWTQFKEICLEQEKLDQLNARYDEILTNNELAE